MRKKKTFTGMIIFLAILVLGVGYATVSNVQLFVNGTANVKANADFSVEFDTSHEIKFSSSNLIDWESDSENTPETAVVAGEYTDTTSATMTVYLDSANRSAYAVYKIVNASGELKAKVAAEVSADFTGTTGEGYLEASTSLYTDEDCNSALAVDAEIEPSGVVYLKVQVDLIKLPVEDVIEADFTITVTGTPADASL